MGREALDPKHLLLERLDELLRDGVPGNCAEIATQLAAGADLQALRDAKLERTIIEGDPVIVETTACI